MSSKKHGGRFHYGISNYRVPEGVTSSAIEMYLTALDCPRSLAVLILFREGEHEQIAEMEFNPFHYNSFVAVRDAYAATKFLSKYKGLTLNSDLDRVAKDKFEKFESLCKLTNSRFRSLQYDRKFSGHIVWLHHAVTRKIGKILGEFSSREFFSMPDWGPGASTLIKRRDSSPAKKFRCETGITRDLYGLIPWETLSESYPVWANQLVDSGFPNFQVGNKVITVPKDATTNRVIAVEPGINLWFQKSIGDMIGNRLRRYGVDLRYQSRNQQLARLGSLSGALTTVDFSSASDSIARCLVEEIIPSTWFSVMDSCRSHFGSLDGKLLKWEKFSSMGNGFTFQLQSLIFYAVACSCAEYLNISNQDISAYGDDVVLPTACLELFSEMVDFYGFKLNTKKSHSDSVFRESCGSHFYSGKDVKPIYLKDRVTSIPAVYRLANAVRRLSHRHNNRCGCDERFMTLFYRLVNSVPSAYRFRIPEGLGDGGFISNLDEATPVYARERKKFLGFEGFLVLNVVEVSKTYQDETIGYLLAGLWQLRANVDLDFGFREHVATSLLRFPVRVTEERQLRLKAIASFLSFATEKGRNSVPLSGRTKYKLANSLSQQWYDLGPWI